MNRAKLLEAVGRWCVDYFNTTSECLICQVDADDVNESGHRPWCPVGDAVGPREKHTEAA